MGSGPLDQIVGLAIDRVPDSRFLMQTIYQKACGKHRPNLVNALASSVSSIRALYTGVANVLEGGVTVNRHKQIGLG
jgi:hypothetical protein